MEIDYDVAVAALRRTPAAVRGLLDGVGTEWLEADEGPDTWTVDGTLAHIVHIEPLWMDRLRHVSEHADSSPFPLVDRTDHLATVGDRSAAQLIDEFESLRVESLRELGDLDFDPVRPGIHAELGPVRMGQLLAAWVTHDHNHIGQMVKAMAKQYRDAIGPWRRFLPIVDAE
jgi:uncharacterized damage-inducible protein DinB